MSSLHTRKLSLIEYLISLQDNKVFSFIEKTIYHFKEETELYQIF